VHFKIMENYDGPYLPISPLFFGKTCLSPTSKSICQNSIINGLSTVWGLFWKICFEVGLKKVLPKKSGLIGKEGPMMYTLFLFICHKYIKWILRTCSVFHTILFSKTQFKVLFSRIMILLSSLYIHFRLFGNHMFQTYSFLKTVSQIVEKQVKRSYKTHLFKHVTQILDNQVKRSYKTYCFKQNGKK